MKYQGITIPKFTENNINEDNVLCVENCIAVSDGAGGTGVFADKWSKYLLDHLPTDKYFASFREFDDWIDSIWEDFFNEYEKKADVDHVLLRKFWDEGSCATLAAIWKCEDRFFCWIRYGDSVPFCYNIKTKRLQYARMNLAHFSHPPHLINCKEPLVKHGFLQGDFYADENEVIFFVASDALSHYLLMMYQLLSDLNFNLELNEVRKAFNTNSQLLMAAEKWVKDDADSSKKDYWKDVLKPLVCAASSEDTFREHLKLLHSQNLLDIDDYSFAYLTNLKFE